jgi:hypothetical protein
MRTLVLSFLLTAIHVVAGGQAAAPAAIPRLPDGKPDLNGVWDIPYTNDMSRGVPGGLPLTPAAAENFKTYDLTNFDYTGHCLPAGLTRLVNTPMPMEIVQTPKKVALLFEGFSSFIVVPTDGRQHKKDPDPTWYGESIGWYEGDTFVMDSIGFNDKTRLDTIGHPHSDQMHVIQRFTRTSPTTIDFEITVEDPKMYTKPFTNKRTFKLAKGELMEYSCEENNKDLNEGHIK